MTGLYPAAVELGHDYLYLLQEGSKPRGRVASGHVAAAIELLRKSGGRELTFAVHGKPGYKVGFVHDGPGQRLGMSLTTPAGERLRVIPYELVRGARRSSNHGTSPPPPPRQQPASRSAPSQPPRQAAAAAATSTVALPWTAPGHHPKSLIGFYYPNHAEPVDALCRAAFLGNFYPAPQGASIAVTYPADGARAFEFSNAEAAFQFSKFVGRHNWHHTLYAQDGWRTATGDDAFRATRDAAPHMQRSKAEYGAFHYGGFANNILAMEAVLAAKFAIPALAAELLGTRTAFLLEHNSARHRDAVWSDNCDGTGQNWLGILLMLLRDRLAQGHGFDWLEREAGAALARAAAQRTPVAMPQHWMRLVMDARNVLVAALGPSAGGCH